MNARELCSHSLRERCIQSTNPAVSGQSAGTRALGRASMSLLTCRTLHSRHPLYSWISRSRYARKQVTPGVEEARAESSREQPASSGGRLPLASLQPRGARSRSALRQDACAHPTAPSAALCPSSPARSRSPVGGSPVFPPRSSPLCWLRTVTQSTEARSTRSAAPVPLPRMLPSPLPALLGTVSTALAHRHCASVLFPARPWPGAQALRTHPRRPGRAPPLSYPVPPPKAPRCAQVCPPGGAPPCPSPS